MIHLTDIESGDDVNGSKHTNGAAEGAAAALAESLVQVMGPRAAFEACVSSQWFHVADAIYRLSTKTPPTFR